MKKRKRSKSDIDEATQLWQLVLSQENDKVQSIGVTVSRWPPETIKLARECKRLTIELKKARK